MYGLLTGTKKLVVVESWPLAEIHRRRRRTRDLTKPRRRRQRERQKTMGLKSKTTTLHVHHAFLYISLPSLHDYDVK